jgi:D-methionine transport system permease protein
VNIFRSIPFIILLVWMIPFTRVIVGTSIGLQAAIVPLTVGAAPFIARMVENALLEIPTGLIEASRAMGATPMQIVRKVLLPEALPGLVNAATITLITLVGYSAMGGAVGAGGLGQIGYQYGYIGYNATVMNTVLVLLVVLVYSHPILWRSHRPGCDSQITLHTTQTRRVKDITWRLNSRPLQR